MFIIGDHVRENWSPIIGIVIDTYDGNCLIQWPSGRKTVVSNMFLKEETDLNQ